MSETTNYKLHLTDNSNERFQEWRNAMNGPDDSNMIKIDKALGEKADRSESISAVLLASAWAGVTAPFTQTLTIDGLDKDQNGTISIAHTANKEQREIAREAMLSLIGQENGKLFVVADGEMPEKDIPVTIIIIG